MPNYFGFFKNKKKYKTISITTLREHYLALFYIFFVGGLECVGTSFAYVAYFVFFRDVQIWT
jgi:hypothetical protein